MHAPSGTRVYRESDDDLPGPVPREVAVGPGRPVASAAEMKELIYLPESYNSLSTCIHTLSLVYLAGPPVPSPYRPSAALGSFSFPPARPFFSSPCRLRPYQLYLNFSPYPPLSAMRDSTVISPLHFPRPFHMAVHAHNFRAPLSVTYVAAFTQPRVQSILSSSTSFGSACTRALLVLYLGVYMLIYAHICVRRTLNLPCRIFPQHVEFTVSIYFSIFLKHRVIFFHSVTYSISGR